MSTIVAPKKRECERCGRRDVWDGEDSLWRIVRDEDGEPKAGRMECLHEWDINGTFNPIADDDA